MFFINTNFDCKRLIASHVYWNSRKGKACSWQVQNKSCELKITGKLRDITTLWLKSVIGWRVDKTDNHWCHLSVWVLDPSQTWRESYMRGWTQTSGKSEPLRGSVKLRTLDTRSATGFPLRLLWLYCDVFYHYYHYIRCHSLLSLLL